MSEGLGRSDKFTIVISFNGIDKEFAIQPQEAVQAVLEHALNDFGISSNRHTMALFFPAPDNREITDPKESVAELGIVAGSRLVLRQSAILAG
jgi:hypothetical protein